MAAPTKPKRRDPKATIAAARLPERSVELCLRGDLVAELQELQRDLVDAQREDEVHASLDGGAPVEIAQKIQALREEMLEYTLVLTLHALPRRKWTGMVAAHPPRDGNDADKVMGLNQETFFDALVRACVVEPNLDAADWAELDDKLSDGQWQALVNAAWAVNARDVDVPFSRRASQILANYETSSELPEPGE